MRTLRLFQTPKDASIEELPDRLYMIKAAAQISGVSLAAELGVEYKHFCRWQNGSVVPSGAHMLQLAKFCDEHGILDILLGKRSVSVPGRLRRLQTTGRIPRLQVAR